jgi:hypothetical protein
MHVREDSVEDAEDARVRMLRAAVEKSVDPSQYMKCLLLDVIETYFVLSGEDAENYRDLVSREENRAVGDFERTWAERLMLTGFFEGKRQTLKRQLTIKFGPLPSGVEGRVDAIAAEGCWTATSRA